MKALIWVALIIVLAVGTIAGYFVGHHDRGTAVTTVTAVSPSQRPQIQGRKLVLRDGDSFRDPRTGTTCLATGEGGIPNLFCMHDPRSRFQVVIWSDSADLYDLARHGEPMVPTYSVPAK